MDVNASLRRKSADAPQPVRIVDISLAGACVEATELISEGSWVTIEILAPTLWDPLTLQGLVVWCQEQGDAPSRAGLMFEHTEERRAFALFELLAALAYEP